MDASLLDLGKVESHGSHEDEQPANQRPRLSGALAWLLLLLLLLLLFLLFLLLFLLLLLFLKFVSCDCCRCYVWTRFRLENCLCVDVNLCCVLLLPKTKNKKYNTKKTETKVDVDVRSSLDYIQPSRQHATMRRGKWHLQIVPLYRRQPQAICRPKNRPSKLLVSGKIFIIQPYHHTTISEQQQQQQHLQHYYHKVHKARYVHCILPRPNVITRAPNNHNYNNYNYNYNNNNNNQNINNRATNCQIDDS